MAENYRSYSEQELRELYRVYARLESLTREERAEKARIYRLLERRWARQKAVVYDADGYRLGTEGDVETGREPEYYGCLQKAR